MKNSRHIRRPATRPAFTLIEVLIVTSIMAILAVAMALAFNGAKNRATFGEHESQVIAIMQQARGLSLSNLLIDTDSDGEGDTATYFYMLEILEDSITLIAKTEDGDSVEINSFEFTEGFTTDIEDTIEIYYFPPYGDICFEAPSCDDSFMTEATFTLSSPEDQETTITISAQGGYPEVVN